MKKFFNDIPGWKMTLSRRAFFRNSLGLYAGLMGLHGRSSAEDLKIGSGNIPIKNIVVILRENHSYDNYFGSYDKGNGKVLGYRCQDEQPDPPHLRGDALRGVSTSRSGDCHYLEEDIPNYFKYAREFTLCDNYFGEARSSSFPNYFMLMAAQTPTMENVKERPLNGIFNIPTIADRLTDKGVQWKNYNGGIPLVKMFKKPYESGNIVTLKEFDRDARKGLLPPVSWVTPHIKDSEHAPYSVRIGEQWTVDRINAIMQGPQWNDTAIFVVWDEWGGFDDHVVPPVVEKEGLSGPVRYGYRIPFLAISPYAKKGHVAHTLYSHSSILRTIERIFDVPPLTEWDAKANDLLECFDFSQARRSPLIL
jgi:phospholipase C